jgi:hypothetical protein
LEDPGIDGRIVLKSILKAKGERMWAASRRPRIGTVAGSCQHGNEPSGSIKGGPAKRLSLCSMELVYTKTVDSLY